jgi:ubiquinone/menaquinone biosynthesis C-methylase UbiE
MDKPMSNVGFAGMSVIIRIRELIRTPKNKLLEIGIKRGAHVLDYGCGPGSFSIEAAKMVGESGKVFAADIHPKAIENVRRRAAKEGLNNIVPIETNTPAPLEADSFDVVILYDIFHHFTNPDSMLQELHRVMKPDAILSFSDHHMKEEAILSGVTGGGLFELSKRGRRTYSFVPVAGQS